MHRQPRARGGDHDQDARDQDTEPAPALLADDRHPPVPHAGIDARGRRGHTGTAS